MLGPPFPTRAPPGWVPGVSEELKGGTAPEHRPEEAEAPHPPPSGLPSGRQGSAPAGEEPGAFGRADFAFTGMGMAPRGRHSRRAGGQQVWRSL